MDVDSYIENAVEEAQIILNELRQIIKTTIPSVEEKIWYNVPFYMNHGELVGLSVSKKHVSFGFGPNVLEVTDRIKLEKKGYKLGKGTMQIQFGQPVPVVAIKKILKAKVQLNKHQLKL